MKVVICGAGQVGFHIARYLSSEQNDVTVVDQSPELIGKINDSLDVQAFVGHASHPDVLARAGVGDADMLIAVTFADEVNMIACQVAHSLFNVPTKIARIRQQDYLRDEWANLFARDQLPIDVIISPEIEVARAVRRRLHVPGASDIIELADGLVRVIGVRCQENCPVIHTPLRQLTSLFPDLNITVMAIVRNETLIIPKSTDQMLPGDEVYFCTESGKLDRAMAVFGHEEGESRRVIIIGGGNIGVNLANDLENHDKYTVRVIELDKARARKVAELLPTTTIIQGDALDSEILEEANVAHAEAIVAVSDHDETNILASLLAKRYGVDRAVALINKSSYGPLITTLGIDVVVSPREITASTILQHVRRGRIRSVHTLRDGFAEVIEAEALQTSPLVGVPLKEAKLPDGVILGAVIRNDSDVIIPRPDTEIFEGDRVVLLAAAHAVKKVEKMFAVRLEYF
ncbi:Trk system potassium transporter TrkA [Hwanghaeella grinnelliae]|uniref:Trk system potassium uptake protein TrkA n=1 Tax=Hwanghaeella grinnelliae TaxID=2500179 RepID=A0A437QXV4_9PROT|nr:Trk system potassium transporter TrkA [Hwanghaeella grinnelliae]RVU39367.1 Trk system potassium transporter TrkA [Hwanghaeella grinnelliae]